MPTGYNKDGSKKVRPANSGRKKVESKSISPRISPEAAAVLAKLKAEKRNLNKYISEAILEKAANEAKRAAGPKESSEANTPGQIDLLDMLQEIHLERAVESIQTAKPETLQEPTGSRFDWEQIQERIWIAKDREQQELNEWLDMPAVETWRDSQRLLKAHQNKKHKSALFLQLRAFMPEEFRRTWRCWLEVVDETGKVMNYTSQKASYHYVLEVMNNTNWRAVEKDDSTTHFLLAINNPIKEVKPKVRKPKPPKKQPYTGDGTLIDVLGNDTTTNLPDWLQPV